MKRHDTPISTIRIPRAPFTLRENRHTLRVVDRMVAAWTMNPRRVRIVVSPSHVRPLVRMHAAARWARHKVPALVAALKPIVNRRSLERWGARHQNPPAPAV